MRRRRKTQSDDAEVDMTPMLDIVFIMLIFFIVTATFLDESGINLTQPPDGPTPENPPPPKPVIRIYVNESNLCAVDNVSTACDRVPLAVEKLLAEKAEASILLRLHEKAPHKTLVYLRDHFDQAGRKSKIEIIPAGA